MNELEKIISEFKTSKPVFSLRLSGRRDTIDSTVIEKYQPQCIEGNIISELACTYYREFFNVQLGEFVIDKDRMLTPIMETITGQLCRFLYSHLEMKAPRQSKLYRFYRRHFPRTSEFQGVQIMLYKYMRSFCDENFETSSSEHIKNLIAVMTAIMEKNEPK